ncbi:MAG: DUF4256 domain-containing protein [Candidatus Kapabacteria bacterium]|nr:DUF4256 domain-containing protein [Candidatus Kapabacteria bacterium]
MKKNLNKAQTDQFLAILKDRFGKINYIKQPKLWEIIEQKLTNAPQKLWSLNAMEESGGEPNVVLYDSNASEFIFYDCVVESPKGRRSFCYDPASLASRKEHKPAHSAIGFADEIGIEMLNKEEYRFLQSLGKFDNKTSSWLLTPKKIRDLGGAIFGDCRYDTVFTYHNGAESYYGSRGFRGKLVV